MRIDVLLGISVDETVETTSVVRVIVRKDNCQEVLAIVQVLGGDFHEETIPEGVAVGLVGLRNQGVVHDDLFNRVTLVIDECIRVDMCEIEFDFNNT